MDPLPSSDDRITPPELYFNRRNLMRSAIAAGSVLTTSGLYRWLNPISPPDLQTSALEGLGDSSLSEPDRLAAGYLVNDQPTPEEEILSYNNFYEFTTSKTRVAALAKDFETTDWRIQVEGLVHNPRSFTLDELANISPFEERIYRMRCVEAWSMVIPWAGFPLSRLLDVVQPTPAAKFVAFETLYDPIRMPGQRVPVIDWPYVEGLRLDEALHPLTLLTTGLYGKPLPNQDGAPVRLVVPWKYDFKGIKSIVKIRLTASQPETSWQRYAPDQYGFYANVNPKVDHPRWSQATERRIGEFRRRPTLMFNGYAEQVADLYTGMDLEVDF